MNTSDEQAFWKWDLRHWYEQLASSEGGLSHVVAEQYLLERGLHPKSTSAFKKDALLLLRQFRSPLVLLLVGAVVVSAFLGNRSDVIIILSIVLITGLLSFFQERNAGKVSERLMSMISVKSTVLRDGQPRELASSLVVPGDMLLLNAGDMLPADCLIIEANELHANESSITGESYPARKAPGVCDENTELARRTNSLWEGTNIVSGEAKALVIRTGDDTLFGSIARNSSEVDESAFEKGIREYGYFLMKITLTLALFILVVNLLNRKEIIDSALFALALAVGMAPELLPAITTIAMSAGAKRLLKKKVIVKKLNAIQNLGEVNVLCSDKTGTITEGTVNVAGFIDGEGLDSDWVRQLACLNSLHEAGYSNPIDEAIAPFYVDTGTAYEKIGEVPFDFMRKRISVGLKSPEHTIIITKGDFHSVLACCSSIRLGSGAVEEIAPFKGSLEDRFTEKSLEGHRVIAVCYRTIEASSITREVEKDMVFAGFVLMKDPVKKDMLRTVKELGQLGVKLKIITGDNQKVSKSIASELGIDDPVIMTGKELAATNPEALKRLVEKTHIFCELDPQQKERIILSLKTHHTVAYMGDGINDVSALKAADVGITVDNAVDAAREAADFVLMEKDLMVLAEGIKEGRKTFANTLKYLFISTGSTFGNMCSVAAASLVLPFLPMLPKQILLTNFISDFPFLTVTTDNVDANQLKKPGRWNLKLLRSYMVVFGLHSSVFDLLTFLVLYFFLTADESTFQTGWFLVSILTELIILFIIRTRKPFYRSIPGKYLYLLSALAVVFTLMMPYLPFAPNFGLNPLPVLHLTVLFCLLLAYAITADMLKIWFFKHHRYA